jgi:hypothetical protein
LVGRIDRLDKEELAGIELIALLSPERISQALPRLRQWKTSETIRKIRNRKKRILAIHAAVPATTANPKMPATIATIKNAIAHPNI